MIQDGKYRTITLLVNQLPKDQKWSKQERDRWLNAIESAVDLLVEVKTNDHAPL